MTRSLGVFLCPMTWDTQSTRLGDRAEVYFITFVLARVGITIPILLFYPGLPLDDSCDSLMGWLVGSSYQDGSHGWFGDAMWCLDLADLWPAQVPRVQLLLCHGGLRCGLDSGAGSHVSWPHSSYHSYGPWTSGSKVKLCKPFCQFSESVQFSTFGAGWHIVPVGAWQRYIWPVWSGTRPLHRWFCQPVLPTLRWHRWCIDARGKILKQSVPLRFAPMSRLPNRSPLLFLLHLKSSVYSSVWSEDGCSSTRLGQRSDCKYITHT